MPLKAFETNSVINLWLSFYDSSFHVEDWGSAAAGRPQKASIAHKEERERGALFLPACCYLRSLHQGVVLHYVSSPAS